MFPTGHGTMQWFQVEVVCYMTWPHCRPHQAGPGHPGEDGPVRQAGPRQPVHLQGGARQVDQEGAQVAGPGHQRQEEADRSHQQGPGGHRDQQGEEPGAVQRKEPPAEGGQRAGEEFFISRRTSWRDGIENSWWCSLILASPERFLPACSSTIALHLHWWSLRNIQTS